MADMHIPKVSVIITCYNHADFIGAAIQSVLDQTFTDFEVIVADDNSTDGSQAVIKQFSDPRLRVILRDKNLGMCRNFNEAYPEARGEYIAHLGSDDMFLPTKLAEQVAVLDAMPGVGVVFTHIELIGKDGQPYRRHPIRHFKHFFNQPNRTRQEWLKTLFSNNCLLAPSSMIRRSAIERVGLYDERLLAYQDYDWWIRFCINGYDLHVIQKPLTLYRRLLRTKSLSAKTLEVYNRGRFEHRHILRHYLSIKTMEEFRGIFKAHVTGSEDELIPYYLAQQALAMRMRTHREFALDILYALFAETPMIDRLNKEYGFTIRDYYRLTTRNALGYPHNVHEWISRVIVPPFAVRLHDLCCGLVYKTNRSSFFMRWLV